MCTWIHAGAVAWAKLRDALQICVRRVSKEREGRRTGPPAANFGKLAARWSLGAGGCQRVAGLKASGFG